jgi:hypothetical protein
MTDHFKPKLHGTLEKEVGSLSEDTFNYAPGSIISF